MPDFAVLVGGNQVASFSELQGITTEVGTVDYVEGRDDPVRFLNRFTARQRPVSLLLVGRSGSNLQMHSWHHQAAANSLTARKNCILVVHNSQNKPVARYHLENAWPQKIQRHPGFTTAPAASGGGAVAMETITIAVEKIDLVRG